ncbi:MAG: efflux RND transporter permease subunit, partial [Blautia sp.]|nr:efflux RND transporter permease subunit [Blautia sp.]
MLESLSVRKPYTVLVGVIIAIALGVVSMMNMSLDLLPNLSLPYLVVVTAYPGASPEKVESEVCIPIEQSLGTISGVTQVQSVCSENFGIVQLEFEDGTNLDSAMVKVSGALNNLESTLPDDCGTPNIMEISMDMLASMYVGVSKEGADIYELSDYVKNTLTPFLERRGGVASITEVGLVEKTIQVDLNKKKIDELNDRILEMTDKALAEAADQLTEARKQVTDAKAMLDEQEKQFGSMVSSGIFGRASGILTGAIPAVRIMIQLVIDRLGDVRNGIYDAAGQAAVMQDALAQSAQRQSDAIDKVNEAARAVDEARAAYNQAQKDYLASYPSYFDRPYEGAVDAQVIMDGDPGFSSDDSELFTSDDVYTGQEYASEPDSGNPFTSDEAGLRVQAVEEARQELARAQEQLAQATSEMTQSMNAGSGEAAEGGFTSGQQLIPEEASELEQLIDGLKEAMELVNSVSVSDVVSGVTSLISLIPRIESALTAVSVWDAAGVLDTVISNAGSGLSSLSQSLNGLPELLKGLETAYAALTQGQLDAAMQFTIASIGLSSADSQLAQAEDQYESAREQALANANMNALLSATTLSQMIYAQNFAMPAGYVDDKEDHSWLLKVGDEYEDSDELARTLLADIDDLGPIRLSDVADVTMIDNSGESFARLNGDHAVLLSIFKSPAAGTNQVSHEMQDAFKELQKRDPDVHIVELMDQGSYIDIIVGDIVQSMLGGAFLAFLVLAVFLRDIRPTILVAISIPLSLMAALVMMYFSGLSLNIMTLAGLALGIGMLVDNSVVVMENIFRLR